MVDALPQLEYYKSLYVVINNMATHDTGIMYFEDYNAALEWCKTAGEWSDVMLAKVMVIPEDDDNCPMHGKGGSR